MSDEKVVWETLTGYQNSFINVKTITSWSDQFSGTRHIKFLDAKMYPLFCICDVVLEANGILRIGTYPFSDRTELQRRVPIYLEELTKDITKLSGEIGQTVFTVHLGANKYTILTANHFTCHFPNFDIRDELFVFLEKEEDLYPQIYCMTKAHRNNDLMNVLDVITYCSLYCFKPAQSPTKFGKEFTYALIQNKIMHKVDDFLPNLNQISLPDNGRDAITSGLHLENLYKLVDASGVDKLIPPSKDAPQKSAPKDSKFSAEQDDMVKNILEKEEIFVSDIFREGVKEVINMLSGLEFIVNIYMDLPGIAKKGCIFEKKMHLIPMIPESETEATVDFADLFDTSDEFFVVCSEETYPKKVKKNGKEN